METYVKLKEQVEAKFGSKISNVNELKILKNHIDIFLDEAVSYNTLRRFFGFLPSTKPSVNTLNKLSKFVGFTDYHHFTNLRDFSDWEVWLKVIRLKTEKQLTQEDLFFLRSIIGFEIFVLNFIDLVNHFMGQKNVPVIKKLFGLDQKNIERSEQLKISVSTGLLIRSLYKNDSKFLESLCGIDEFRRTVIYNFIDYSFLNKGYLQLLEQCSKSEKEKEHQLFLSLILLHSKFLNGKRIKSEELLFEVNDYSDAYPIVKGRYFAFRFSSCKIQDQQLVFKEMISYCKFENKCEFFFEVIPVLILIKRLDLIEEIFILYAEDIFEINSYNRLTHQGLFQVAQALISIQKAEKNKARKELESINYNLAFDSYLDYTRLFYLLAKYQLSNKKEVIEDEYIAIVKRTKLKRFSIELLKHYFH